MATDRSHLPQGNGSIAEESLLIESRREKPADLPSEKFNPNEQTWRLFKVQSVGLLLTTTLTAFITTTLKIFETRGNISITGVRVFSFITTALFLFLGVNLLEAFKNMAKILRWKVLAYNSWDIRETDLILGADSLRNNLTLIWESTGMPLTRFICAAWIALILTAQVSIALMQLCFSIESGKNSNDTIKRNSEVFDAIKLDCYYVNGICVEEPNSAPIVAQNLAHTYGDTIRGQRSCPYTSDSEIQNAPQNCYYFSNTNGKEFAARYAEYNPDDSARAYPFFSNRIVKTFAGECFQYEIFNFPNKIIKTDSHDGIQDTWVWEYYNSTVNDTIDIPRREAALDATTYIYNGFHEPDSEEATRQTCGPRCSWLYAWHSKRNSTDRPLLFRCPINVSEVSNVNNDLQEVPNRIARLAAASIALTGRKTNDWRQFRLYPWGSHWDIGNNITTSGVGARMAEFAIGSLATMANLNPQFRTQGTLPVLGYHLSIKWAYVITVAAFIAVTHFILVVSMLIIARSVVVNDDSNLCTARLLVGLLQRFEKQGSLLDGKRIANAIQDEEGTGERRLVYGKVEKEGRRWLSLGKDVKVIKGRFSSEEYA